MPVFIQQEFQAQAPLVSACQTWLAMALHQTVRITSQALRISGCSVIVDSVCSKP